MLASNGDVTDGNLQTSNREEISGSVLGDKRKTRKECNTAVSNPCISPVLQGNLVCGTVGSLETPMVSGQAFDSMITTIPPQQVIPSAESEAAESRNCGSQTLLRTETRQQANPLVDAESVANRYCGNHFCNETSQHASCPVGDMCGTINGKSGCYTVGCRGSGIQPGFGIGSKQPE